MLLIFIKMSQIWSVNVLIVDISERSGLNIDKMAREIDDVYLQAAGGSKYSKLAHLPDLREHARKDGSKT